MQTQVLRDRNSQPLGTLSQENGVVVLRDKHNNRLGSYSPKTNETRDNHNRLIGRGNLLVSLLEG